MIIINADSLRDTIESLKGKRKAIQEEALVKYRAKILAMFYELLMVTPQYSSDMVSNWDIETASSRARPYSEWREKDGYQSARLNGLTPHEAGEKDAGFNSSYMRGVSRMRYITYYGEPVYFVNPTILEIESPMIIGADGVQKLRDGVVISAWDSIESYLKARYGAARS